MLQEGLFTLLKNSSALQVLLGTPGTRTDQTSGIFAVQMPEATPLPAIVHSQITGSGVMTHDGPSALRFARIQFSCYGKVYADSKRLARTLRQLLETFTGALADGTVIGNIAEVSELDTFEEAPFIYHTPVDLEVLYQDLGT